MACEDKPVSKKSIPILVLVGEEEMTHNINVGNMILNAFKSKPDFIGQIDAVTEEQTTFREMREKSVKCALWLQKVYHKYYKNIVISICTCNPMLAYIPFLAGLYVGAVINPWDEKYFISHIRIVYFLIEYKPKIIFIDSKYYQLLKQNIKVLRLVKNGQTPPKIITFDKIEDADSLDSILNDDFDEAEIENFSCEKINPMKIMVTMFSSNATSYPGRVNIRNFAFMYPSNQEAPTMSSGDIGLWYGSLTWNYSVILTVRSIISYVTVIRFSNFTTESMYETIEEYKVKWVFLESSMYNELFTIDIRMYDISSLKELVFSDTDVHWNKRNLIKYFTNVTITQVYGLSEAGIVATYERNNNNNNLIVSGGYTAKNIKITIADRENRKRLMKPYMAGEIKYKFNCNWCNPETCNSPYCYNYQAKENTINEVAYTPITSMWHYTGDYGFCQRDGKIVIIDKVKDLIKYREYLLSPRKIENVLRCHPAISEVIVRSEPNSTDGQHPRAYITIKKGAKVTKMELVKLIENILPGPFHLRVGVAQVRIASHMPHLPNGKIDPARVKYEWKNGITYKNLAQSVEVFK